MKPRDRFKADLEATMLLLRGKDARFYRQRSMRLIGSESLFMEFLFDLWATTQSAVTTEEDKKDRDTLIAGLSMLTARTVMARHAYLDQNKKR